MRALLVFILTSCFIPAALPVAGATSYQGTVVLDDGERLEDVKFKYDSWRKVLRVEEDGSKRYFSLIRIEALYNADGEEITASVLGKDAWPAVAAEAQQRRIPARPIHVAGPQPQEIISTDEPVWRSEHDAVVKRGRRAPWTAVIRLSPSFSVPFGDYYDGVDAGVGFEADLRIGINHQLGLRLSGSRSGAKSGVSWADITIYRVLVGLEYFDLVSDRDLSHWYLFGSLGFINQDVESLLGGDPGAKFAISSGGGYLIGLSPNLGLDFAAEWTFIAAGESEYGSTSANLLDFSVGFNIIP